MVWGGGGATLMVWGGGAGGGGSLVGTGTGRRGPGPPGASPLAGAPPIIDATNVPCASQSDRPSPPPITKSPPGTRCGSLGCGVTPVSMTAIRTPPPRPKRHASGRFSMSMYFGCTRKSEPGNTPTSVQYALCFIGWGGPGGASGGTAAGSMPGGSTAYAGAPDSATDATMSVVAATAAARSGRSRRLPVANRCINIHQPQCQREDRHQAEILNPFHELAEQRAVDGVGSRRRGHQSRRRQQHHKGHPC